MERSGTERGCGRSEWCLVVIVALSLVTAFETAVFVFVSCGWVILVFFK